jgi:chlorophyllide a oxygenase
VFQDAEGWHCRQLSRKNRRLCSNCSRSTQVQVEVPVEHGLLMENLLDLAHAPFTHTSTFAKGWPVPDAVRFHAQRLLSGNWDPYPIDMSFEPPCMVVSMIGLKQPGQIEAGARAEECQKHLHQLHACLPSRRGHTRLLYRMSLDFMPWIQYVPGITRFWTYIAGQVLGEDLVLVLGQQKRMQKGGDTWSNPVSYDKLAVRYRRWRNGVAVANAPHPEQYHSHSMNAGDLFSIDEEDFSPELDFYVDQR